ncbi:hypothetical protein [Nodularia sphaerocarpa]|uniref:hypothetical protein n=1 Tax=Nodularia sphaerocarpa TaxID=137816 RepID=UPI001EFB345C|nr:hypothetical protein [Nodularia sphaerocarpa]
MIFVLFLTSCSKNPTFSNTEVNSPQPPLPINSDSTNSETTANSSKISATPSPTLIDPDQQVADKLTEIKLRCGETYNFDNFEISSECPPDNDKDGRPDQQIVTFSFLNKSPQHSYLTFGGNVSLYFENYPKFQNYTYTHSSPRPLFYSTAKVNSNEAIKIDQSTNNFSDESIFLVGIGKVKINSSESKLLSLKCPNNIVQDRAYGVVFELTCFKNSGRLLFTNHATEARGVKVEYIQRGTSWVYSRPYLSPSTTYYILGISLPHKSQNSNDYQAEIFYYD